MIQYPVIQCPVSE